MFPAPLGFGMDLRWPSVYSASRLLAVPSYTGLRSGLGLRKSLSLLLVQDRNDGMLEHLKTARGT
jgi:hypothetical protein